MREDGVECCYGQNSAGGCRRYGLPRLEPAAGDPKKAPDPFSSQAVVNGTVAEGYSYDAVGNRLTSAGPVSYNYNSSNELTSDSNATFTYDNNGNTASKTDSTGTTSYTWDFENRLTSVTLPGTGGTVNFKYDPFGRRIEKIAPTSGTTIYAYDGDNITEELGSGGNLLAQYTQGASIDEPLALTGAGGTYYYHPDGLGSITSLTDGSGQLAASYVYDSFGRLTDSTGSITNPLQYTAREFDSEIGLYYYRARDFDPSLGRFLSEDPTGFAGGDDFYVYSEDNPASLVDPYGLQASSALESTWNTTEDLGLWFLGQGSRAHYAFDPVTADMRQSPAWQDLLTKVKKANCAPGRYYGQFKPGDVFKSHNYNLTIQSVGSFGADITFNGDTMIVRAFNDWGFKSLTKIPGTPYLTPTLQDMILNGAKKGVPSSIFNNSHSGPMAVKEFTYYWTEKSPCCKK